MRLRKLIAFAVALAMVLSIVPVTGMAADEETNDGVVAFVEGVGYSTLVQAIAAAETACVSDFVTVTLADDTKEDIVIEYGLVKLVTEGYSYTGTVTVEGGMLIADCELAGVECDIKGTDDEGTSFGYAGITTGIEMVDGAQVRIGEGADESGRVSGMGSGLRFISMINQSNTIASIAFEHYDAEEAAYDEGFEIGVRITAEGGSTELDIAATRWQVEGEMFTTALTNLSESNYNRRFTATAYVKVCGVRFDNEESVTRSIYQVAAGLLSDTEAGKDMSDKLVGVLNAYVNGTGVRLTLSDKTENATLTAATGAVRGAYTGEATFRVGETIYRNGRYTVVLTAIGRSYINTSLFNEYVRINNNNSAVSPLTTIVDNGDGTYTVTFDYADTENGSGVINEPVTLANDNVVAYIPEGVTFTGSSDKLQLILTSIEDGQSEVEAGEGEELNSFDIHVSGIAADNTTPIVITLAEIAEAGLNRGNLRLYHVEDGVQVEMEQVDSVGELTKHNQFTYNPLDGTIAVALASFSEVALVSNTENCWNGKIAEAFAGGTGGAEDPYLIANADQLAFMNYVVSNKNDEYGNAYYKLTTDINIGRNAVFYPVGYLAEGEGTNAAGEETWYKFGGAFSGEFDGNGHTIRNIYQNTWEMDGDYNNGYWNDAMGLFGYVNGGTVKNLTVDNFSSDGEYTPTGVIAAYAANSTFENIAITNCNPRVYNTGNGGIVGIGGNTSDTEEDKLTFANITIDNTNKISALWGSWDVACGGLVGMFRGGGYVDMTNCHVAAQMDVYNDVCGNYQYYWYRYSGMLIGTNKNMTTDEDGYTVPETDKFHAENCTVHFGEWNDYYYCELVANSIASYTHDHQFSRLEQVDDVDLDNMKVTVDGVATEIPTSGRYNYVVVVGEDTSSPTNTSCHHFVDGKVWNHEDAGTETVDGEEVDVEDKTCVYLPFNQLFTGYGWGVKHIPIYNDPEIKNTFAGVTILDREVADSKVKFETKFTGDFLYRVGNQNTVALGSLFEAVDDAEINDSGVYVTIDKVDEETSVSGTYTANTADWTKGTIQFSGTGVVKVTIQDYNYCVPTELYLEVVDAKNVTSAEGTTSGGNFVLLCDVNTADYVNYWNSTLYGNGFTYSLNGAPTAYSSSHGHGVIMTKNAILDNLVIVGDVYGSYGAYTSQDYYNAAVDVISDTIIQNCYISNCAAPVNARSNVTIKNTTLYGGTVANLIIKAGTVTLENVTTANYADGRALVGMGIVAHSDVTEGAKLIINGTLKQYNFINEANAPSDTYAKQLYSAMFNESCSKYHFGTSPNRYVNTGIISMSALFNEDSITDNANTGYEGSSVAVGSANGYVYTQPNTSGSVDNEYSGYIPTEQSVIPPTVSLDNSINDVAKTDGSNDYCYEENGIVYISMDEGDSFSWDTSILTAEKTGQTLDYEVTMNGTDYTGKSITFNTADSYDIIYTYTDGYNYKLNDDGEIVTYDIEYTRTITIKVSVVTDTTKHAEFSFGSNGTASKQVTIGNNTYVMPDVESTSDSDMVGSITVSNTTVYYPIVDAYTSDGKTEHSSTTWYMCYPVFKNVVSITDYENSGTGDKVVCGSETTTMPTGLSLTAYSKYFSQSTAPSGEVSFTTGGADAAFKYQASNSAAAEPKTLNNVLIYASPTLSNNARDELYLLVQYKYQDNAGASYYYYVGYHMPKTTVPSSCITPETLITLADGSQVEVQYLTGDEELLVWNLETGKYDAAPVVFIDVDDEKEYEIIHLYFEDETDVEVIYEHGFFDVSCGEYVYLDKNNAEEHVGHSFVMQEDIALNAWKKVELTDVVIEKRVTKAYSPVTFEHLCYYTDGMLSMPGGIAGLFNIFEVDTDVMAYDAEKMAQDIETYGLYTYADFEDIIPEIAFEAYNGDILKVAVGKGMLTWERICELAERYVK